MHPKNQNHDNARSHFIQASQLGIQAMLSYLDPSFIHGLQEFCLWMDNRRAYDKAQPGMTKDQ